MTMKTPKEKKKGSKVEEYTPRNEVMQAKNNTEIKRDHHKTIVSSNIVVVASNGKIAQRS